MAITSHPADARYFGSRAAAQAAAGQFEKVVRLGTFASGSFGLTSRRGRRVLTVWMVTSR